MDLNPHQERAVTAPGHCTVLACPGSGKTRVLSARATHLLTNNEKGRLCAVTFTREGADELRSRILQACGTAYTRRLAAGTFHSIVRAQLNRYSKTKMPRLISDGEQMAVLRRCWKEHVVEAPFDDLVKAVNKIKSGLSRPKFNDPEIEAAYHAYIKIMESEGAIDFSDLLLIAVRRIASGEMPTMPIRWLLVDEAQDMDEVQKEWVLLHGRAGVEVTIVGDDDQSLYEFRHALGYTGIQDISFALAATETTLPVNYRCAPNILGHAAKLISVNQNRAAKKISAHRADTGKIDVRRFPDRWSEVDDLAITIRNEAVTGSWAVLGRTNTILDAAEIGLSSLSESCTRSGGKSIWEHAIGSLFIGLLQNAISDSWTGVANALAFCGINAEWVNNHSLSSNGATIRRLDTALEYVQDTRERKILLSLRMGLASWHEQAAKGRASLVIHGVSEFLVDYCKPSQANLLRRLEASLAKMQGTLAQRIALIGRDISSDKEKSQIQIMTLHASKGLEFDNVWIMGCEDGNIPHTDSTEEEERRLLYVGMTRARHQLILSSSMEDGLESRFLEEAGLG